MQHFFSTDVFAQLPLIVFDFFGEFAHIFPQYMLKLKDLGEQCTVGEALALHAASLGSIPSTSYDPPSDHMSDHRSDLRVQRKV